MTVTNGAVKPGFEAVARAFEANFSSAEAVPDIGASFAVIRGDEVIVDLWGGHADKAKSKPWAPDTLANVYSTTKGVASACTMLLESRGELDYEAKVARYWPEFAQGGKGEITVGMLLSHRAGLSGLREPTTVDDLFDWELMTTRLAHAEPLWTPGTVAGYHAITWGFLAGELVRRIDGRTIGRFLREELAEPLGADVFIGLPDSQDGRYAEIAKPLGEQTQSLAEMTDILRLTLTNPVIEGEVPNRREWRAAEIPAAGGCANALGLARLFALLANDGVFEGRRYCAPGAVARATMERFNGVDMNLGVPVRWGAGFFGNNPQRWYGPDDTAWGHSGWGGSCAFFDPPRTLAVAFAMNQMDANLHGDPRTVRLVSALYSCL
ncbi:MAG TPA: serine hydrolase domain-containing protein [Caulobacteraceae bacterium]